MYSVSLTCSLTSFYHDFCKFPRQQVICHHAKTDKNFPEKHNYCSTKPNDNKSYKTHATEKKLYRTEITIGWLKQHDPRLVCWPLNVSWVKRY